MAAKKQSAEATLMQRKIFNKLCMGYRRSCEDPMFAILADALMKELSIPKDIFAEALYAFIHTENQTAVEVFQREGQTYLRLGESARDICNDWSTMQRNRPASKPNLVIKIPVRNPFLRSA
jgi:hypothetical protein